MRPPPTPAPGIWLEGAEAAQRGGVSRCRGVSWELVRPPAPLDPPCTHHDIPSVTARPRHGTIRHGDGPVCDGRGARPCQKGFGGCPRRTSTWECRLTRNTYRD
ncbi:hypothetical protein AAFF_G00067080 [Aldrovandia affinis]|uniref:Uncharacterized protein n=1 Tax=Aldrovandia affinis TaxID=143900 RepID=A0AAD7T469_9TELE|nr:hypothetical protein AAFF_G00067080 [Aldrovandia affinis]